METPLLQPIPPEDWNIRAARHLLSRAGFGLPRSLVSRLAEMQPEAAVDHLLEYERTGEEVREPACVLPPRDPQEIKAALALLSEEERRKAAQEYRRAEREAVEALKAWWLELMYTTRCPLREKMALFWHGHFATSAQKVRSSYFNYRLNDVFRRHATGNFKALTIAVGQSPAMLRYLDNVQSTKKQPNENWARELMELFTLGQGHYTERDIKESARAFTGWSADYMGFDVREGVQDFGEKTFLGRRGDFDGWDIVNVIFEQPAAAEFIGRKLWMFFASEDAPPDVVKGLAGTLRRNNYELKPLLRKMFLSRAFYGDNVVGAQIKSPVQFALQLADDMGSKSPPFKQMARATGQLGQNLFYPPNVKGWDGNRAWINANSLLMRYNMPVEFVAAQQASDRRTMTEAERLDARPMSDAAMSMQAAEPPARKAQPWEPRRILADLRFETVGECIEALERHFLAVPLSPEQRNVLVEAMGVPGGASAPLTPADLPGTKLRSVLHLLLSTPEYQLC